jgi:tartrate-resistant acid phosphatase type 5
LKFGTNLRFRSKTFSDHPATYSTYTDPATGTNDFTLADAMAGHLNTLYDGYWLIGYSPDPGRFNAFTSSHPGFVRNVTADEAKRHCRFIVSVGDNFYEKGVQSAVDPQWKSSFEDVYTASSLAVPWYAILGNHDYKGRPQAQLDYAKSHPNWKMPTRYFSAVEAINAAWKIVIGHHPIFSGGSEHGDQPELIRDINPLLEKHRVPVYFNGHDHDLQHIVRGSVEYFNTGAGSKVREPGPVDGSRFYRGTPGFMAVTLTAKEMRVEVIDYTGASLYETRVQNRAVVGA